MKISNNDSIKQASHSFLTAVAKNENHDTSSVDQWLSKAADVYISKSGKELRVNCKCKLNTNLIKKHYQ